MVIWIFVRALLVIEEKMAWRGWKGNMVLQKWGRKGKMIWCGRGKERKKIVAWEEKGILFGRKRKYVFKGGEGNTAW